MHDMVVSIIIPVYNCENELPDCLESVLGQSYHDMEVIVIDDGSIDSSGRICDFYAKKDERIKVHHIANAGVSNARNFGLQQARGKYIQFVDGDDTVKANMTQQLVYEMDRCHADLVVSGYIRTTKYMTRHDKFWDKEGIYSCKDYLVRIMQEPTSYYYGAIWNKLYRKDIIDDNKLNFDRNVNLGEDFIFNLDYLVHTKKIKVIHKRLYCYNYKNTGTLSKYKTRGLEVLSKELNNRNIIFSKYISCFKLLNMNEICDKDIYKYWIRFYFDYMYSTQKVPAELSIQERQEWERMLKSNANISILLSNLSRREELCHRFRAGMRILLSILKRPIKKLVSFVR